MVRIVVYTALTFAWVAMFFYAIAKGNGLVVALSAFMSLLYSARVALLTLAMKEGRKVE